jgi:hypothetical protein
VYTVVAWNAVEDVIKSDNATAVDIGGDVHDGEDVAAKGGGKK